MCCRSPSTRRERRPVRASSATSSSVRSTPPTCVRPSSTARCTSSDMTTRPTTARCCGSRTRCFVSTRSGFVALAGRPNVGKSTLVNGIVGRKVAIVSDKPQTTRRAIRGVATSEDAQLVLVDLPGVQRPLDALTERMQRRVERELAESDGALLLLNAEQGIGPGDRWIAGVLGAAPVPVIIAVNKTDRLSRPEVARVLQEAADLDVAEE